MEIRFSVHKGGSSYRLNGIRSVRPEAVCLFRAPCARLSHRITVPRQGKEKIPI